MFPSLMLTFTQSARSLGGPYLHEPEVVIRVFGFLLQIYTRPRGIYTCRIAAQASHLPLGIKNTFPTTIGIGSGGGGYGAYTGITIQ